MHAHQIAKKDVRKFNKANIMPTVSFFRPIFFMDIFLLNQLN